MNETRSSILENDGEWQERGQRQEQLHNYTGVVLLAPFGDCVSTSSSATASAEQHRTAQHSTEQNKTEQNRTVEITAWVSKPV